MVNDIALKQTKTILGFFHLTKEVLLLNNSHCTVNCFTMAEDLVHSLMEGSYHFGCRGKSNKASRASRTSGVSNAILRLITSTAQ